MLYGDTRRELERREDHDDLLTIAGGSRTQIVNALVWASPEDSGTFADFVRLGRLRRRKAAGESFSREALADLEERFS
jgi:hypothetical protein